MNIKDQFANAENELKKGRVQAAVDVLKSILKNQPDEPNSLRLLGLIALGQKDYKASVEFLEQACRSAPTYPTFLIRMTSGSRLHQRIALCHMK